MIRATLIAATALTVVASASSLGQTYPTKPVRVVSNAASGSPGDIALRLAAPKAAQTLGQPLVIETKGGGGGQIAAQDVIRSGNDGYTVLYSSSMIVTSKYLLKELKLDFAKDLVPVNLAARSTNLLAVHASLPVRNLRELVDYAKKNPGKLSYSSNGIGSSLHLQFIGFGVSTGADLFHVPYGSANEGLRNNDFLTGRISLSLIPYSSLKPALDAGQVRVLGVMGDARYKRLPDVPAMTEAFPDYRLTLGWWGTFGPAGMPAGPVSRLSAELQKGLRDAEIVAKLDAIDIEAVGGLPQEFAAFLKNYDANIAAVVKAAKLEAQ